MNNTSMSKQKKNYRENKDERIIANQEQGKMV